MLLRKVRRHRERVALVPDQDRGLERVREDADGVRKLRYPFVAVERRVCSSSGRHRRAWCRRVSTRLARFEKERVGAIGVGDGAPRERRQHLLRSKRARRVETRHRHHAPRTTRVCVVVRDRERRVTVFPASSSRATKRAVVSRAPRIPRAEARRPRSRRRGEQRARPRLRVGHRDAVPRRAFGCGPIARFRWVAHGVEARLADAGSLTRETGRAFRDARVSRGLAPRHSRHVRGRASQPQKGGRVSARVPAVRVPQVEPRAPRRVRRRRDGASRVRRRLGGAHRVDEPPKEVRRSLSVRRVRRGCGGRLEPNLRAWKGHDHPARALRGALLSL